MSINFKLLGTGFALGAVGTLLLSGGEESHQRISVSGTTTTLLQHIPSASHYEGGVQKKNAVAVGGDGSENSTIVVRDHLVTPPSAPFDAVTSLSYHDRLSFTSPAQAARAERRDSRYLASSDLYLHTAEAGCGADLTKAAENAATAGKCWAPPIGSGASLPSDIVRVNPLSGAAASTVALCKKGQRAQSVRFSSFTPAKAAPEAATDVSLQRCAAGGPLDTLTFNVKCRGAGGSTEEAPFASSIEALCLPSAADPFSGLVLSRGGVGTATISGTAPAKRYLIDVGTHSSWSTTDADSLSTLFKAFTAAGLAFTEVYSWRPSWSLLPAPKFFKDIPGYLKPAYHYFNYPPHTTLDKPSGYAPYTLKTGDEPDLAEALAPARPLGPNGAEGGTANDNPLNHIRIRTAPRDWVVLKVCYAAFGGGNGDAMLLTPQSAETKTSAGLTMTSEWLRQVLEDNGVGGSTPIAPLSELVDEVFVCLGATDGTAEGLSEQQKTIVGQLHRLRKRGIRTHLWV